MNEELMRIVEQIWQQPDKQRAASVAVFSMSATTRKDVGELLSSLHRRASARHLLEGNTSILKANCRQEERGDLSEGELVNVVMLLTMATYHSDSFCFLPPELRSARMEEWGRLTGLASDIVKEAIALGQDGLRNLR